MSVAVSAGGPLFVSATLYVNAWPTFVGVPDAARESERFGAGPTGFEGVTGADAADAGPVPSAFVAVTVKL